MICKKFFAVFLLLFCLYSGSCFGMQYGKASISADYSKADIEAVYKKAEQNFNLALIENDKEKQKLYLREASTNYYIVTEVQHNNIDAIIKLARTYGMQDRYKLAKSYFFKALGINSVNVDANYYFGEFYYNQKEYRMALNYYRKAFEYGLKENSQNLARMAEVYEKLGDLQRANLYYKLTFLQNPQDNEIADKIREIEGIKYQKSGYYRRR